MSKSTSLLILYWRRRCLDWIWGSVLFLGVPFGNFPNYYPSNTSLVSKKRILGFLLYRTALRPILQLTMSECSISLHTDINISLRQSSAKLAWKATTDLETHSLQRSATEHSSTCNCTSICFFTQFAECTGTDCRYNWTEKKYILTFRVR
jgi:hypothetical protein